MKIRAYQDGDWSAVWNIIKQECLKGETLALSPEITEQEANDFWINKPQETYVAINQQGIILGTYFLKPNQAALGSHVCNCGYIVASEGRGQGIGSEMCRHSLELAKELGYKAMQFNFVISTNQGAVRLWEKFGFKIVGTLPKAFHRKREEFVDALIMYKKLVDL